MKSLFFFFFYFFVSTMNDCCFGTDTINHCINREIFFFLFFNLSDGSLLSDTEKLCFFLLLIVKFILRRSYYEICFVLTQSISRWSSQQAWSYLRDPTSKIRVSLYARAYFITISKTKNIFFLFWNSFIFQEY
jgi:hypothetical protein